MIKDVYTWHAIYDDDAVVSEYDREEGRGFAEVDQSRVKSLLLISHAGDIAHRVDVPTGAQPVFFRRRTIELQLTDGQGNTHPVKHCIGWKRGESAVYLFVFEDGSTLLSSDLQSV